MHSATNSHNDWLYERDLSGSIAEILSEASDPIFGGEFKADYLRRNLLSKFSSPDRHSQKERRDRAITKLLAQEGRNRETTLRLKFDTNKISISSVHVQCLLMTAKSYICKILGDLDPKDWLSLCEFSSGASTTRKRCDAFLHKKHDNRSSASAQVIRMLDPASYAKAPLIYLIAQFQESAIPIESIVMHDYNELFTVPKNNEIDRCAAKEPDWNMFLQKGLGSLIRKRLLAEGVNLNDQSINNAYARKGSIDSSLATLDLSAASDSITEELVFQLLPTEWFEALSAVKSNVCKLPDGSYHKWVLFSTMGNGFTFELESLIFYALAKAVAYHFGIKGVISVYGDDIICPTALATHLVSLFAVCGFVTNPDKSFIEGPFRESCGGHYYRGVNVTPIYIREPITNVPQLINIINQFRLWSCNNDAKIGTSHNFQLWKRLTTLIPKHLRNIVIGGNDVYQRSYVAAAIPFKGAIMACSRVKTCTKLDSTAAYNSWAWQSAASSDLDWAWGVSKGRQLFEFGSFTKYSKPLIDRKGNPVFSLLTKQDLRLTEPSEDYRYTLIRDDGYEYRYNSSRGESVFVFIDELIKTI